ncbi:ankyrin repeat domain 34Bb [Alosa pseudoharengus]|uniref:ankyrin repeat domain 34Bb n=1 Tax=Alosa pseudoharengus TaxID=34774 RepID=UPI003F8CF22C
MDDSPTEVRTDGNSLLKAVYLSRLRLTRLLLEGGAYINESNERGETPLMVACRTPHSDAQSVPKAKMVKYLLESDADPNIQDKSGKTALMHACMERAGMEVLSLLLSSGADPSLEDHSGSSALVYAVNSGDKDALRVLLDACKAKGKEVIIITTDKLPSGRQMTKQYLNVPPPPDLEDRLHCTPASCMSPSEIQLCTPPHPLCTALPECQRLGQRDSQGLISAASAGTSQPGSPTHTHTSSTMQAPGVAKLLHLQRLHSEPWLKIPPSLLLQQSKGASLTEELQDITPEEELTFQMNGLPYSRRTLAASRHQSIDVKDGSGLLRALEHGNRSDKDQGGGARALLSRKMSYDSASSLQHFSSHHNLGREGGAVEAVPVDRDVPDCLPNLAVSSLRNVVRRRNIGMDHYSSDSQLPQFSSQTSEERAGSAVSASEKRKLVPSRSSTLSGSRESLEGLPQRRAAAGGMLERRGSGALLLDHIAQTRPGYLPPLNPHAPIPDIKVNSATAALSGGPVSGCKLAATGVPIAPPGAAPAPKPFLPFAPNLPRDAKAKKTLLRRHSMQTEQIKQLVNFEEIFGQ